MSAVQGTITPAVFFNQTASGIVFGGSALAVTPPLLTTLLNGTGATNRINLLSYSLLSFAGSAVTLDLTSLLDVYGNAVNLAKVRALIAVNFSATYDFLLGNAGANEWDGFLSSGGILRVPASSNASGPTYDGYAIVSCPAGVAVDGTHKLLKADPGANTFTGAILLAGSTT